MMMSETCPSQLDSSLEEKVASDASSSTTEGPDSPGQSACSSPLVMPSTPTHAHRPRFHVQFTDDVSKDGDAVRFSILVRRLVDAQPDGHLDSSQPVELTLERQYEDFEFLHHTLVTSAPVNGVVVPPLPPKPTSPSIAASVSLALADSANVAPSRRVRGDDFEREVRALEKYLRLMLAHPIFGNDSKLTEFLSHRNPPIRTKIRGAGFLSGVRQSFETRKLATVKDPDDFLAKERDWAGAYSQHAKEASNSLQALITAQVNVSNQLGVVSSALSSSAGDHLLAASMEEVRPPLEAAAACADRSLGAYLRLWTAYVEAENAMLARRAALLVEAEAADKALAKATNLSANAAKMEQARVMKEERDSEVAKCSKVAREELSRLHQRRVSEMRDALLQLADGQANCAREAYRHMAKCMGALREAAAATQGKHIVTANGNEK